MSGQLTASGIPWPVGTTGATKIPVWRYSDAFSVAYPFLFGLYDKIVIISQQSIMKTLILSLMLAAIPFVDIVAQQNELPRAKLTVRVLDEAGKPVVNAQVRIQFLNKTSGDPAMSIGPTDLAGEYTAEGNSTIALSADVKKDGYYGSATSAYLFKTLTNGVWYPWNPTVQTAVRKIENPIPMYAKVMHSKIPEMDKACGYDLEIGDWVAPYGKGTTSDFILTWTNRTVPNFDFDGTAILTFSNPLDGIQEADLHQFTNTVFRWPRQAPEISYQTSFTARYAWPAHGNGESVMTFNPDGLSQAYFFRVRTVEQDGKIVSAHYGKIIGGLEIFPKSDRTCMVRFRYYLNPTPLDRNMEFDLKQNLFKNLSYDQQPRFP